MMKQADLIDMKKVFGLKMVCKGCRGAYLIPIQKSDRVAPLCPFCQAPLDKSDKVNETKRNLVTLIEIIREISHIANFDFYLESDQE